MHHQDDLIFDIGANNGDDTAYYLREGFRVVAVEANPVLAADIERRFSADTSSGRLTVLNVGIAGRAETVPFWVNDEQSVWSSFDRELSGREGSRCHSVAVRCLPLGTLLEEHGIPHYVKIDIEGYDSVCLGSLTFQTRPPYISCEVTHGDGLIDRLHALGYRRFKLVNQGTFTEASPVFDNELAFRGLRKLCVRVPVVKKLIPDGIRTDFDTFVCDAGYSFPHGSSGPFAEKTWGDWRRKDDVLKRYDDIRRRYLRARVPLEHCWYDVHARD
ncbi:MAG TPA: FkbM family methyltransferase [Vicinamibacterales bacterium]|jgi:FkbM family methyltransferase